jgi:hypothetical protein
MKKKKSKGTRKRKTVGSPRTRMVVPSVGVLDRDFSLMGNLTSDSIAAAVAFASAMEHIAPPAPHVDADAPAPGKQSDLAVRATAPPALNSVASFWSDSCAGGDKYENNCAHFLSDAFIRAGYVELNGSVSCVNARCGTPAKRPIRARDMWCWFQAKATKTSTQLTRNTGWWVVFQLNEPVYWGGHVALFDSDNWKYYGTNWFPDWSQYLYQW